MHQPAKKCAKYLMVNIILILIHFVLVSLLPTQLENKSCMIKCYGNFLTWLSKVTYQRKQAAELSSNHVPFVLEVFFKHSGLHPIFAHATWSWRVYSATTWCSCTKCPDSYCPRAPQELGLLQCIFVFKYVGAVVFFKSVSKNGPIK